MLSQFVIVPKNNEDVRLCIDMQNANSAIEKTRCPTATVDDLLVKLKDAEYFTKLDLNAAFHISHLVLIFLLLTLNM